MGVIALGNRIYRVKGSNITSSNPALPLRVTDGTGLYWYSNYPKLWIKDSSVKIEGLIFEMKMVLDVLQNMASNKPDFSGFIITSGNDGKHMQNSLHKKWRAIDLSIREAGTWNTIKGIVGTYSTILNELRKTLNSTGYLFDVAYETEASNEASNGAHVHIAFNPKGELQNYKLIEEPAYPDSNQVERQKITSIVYYHKDASISTFPELLQSPYSLFLKYREDDIPLIDDKKRKVGLTKEEKQKELEDYKGNTEFTNRERIEATYEDLSEIDEDAESEEWPLLKVGTQIFLPPDMVNRDFLATQSNSQVINITTVAKFQADERIRLEENPLYVPTDEVTESQHLGSFQVPVHFVNSFLSVWIYSKALGQIIDITDFCKNVQTTSAKNDFFSLDVIFFNEMIDIVGSGSINKGNYTFGDTVISSEVAQRLSYLFKNISQNDIIWIRFEELKTELKDNRNGEMGQYIKRVSHRGDRIVLKSSLAGQIYDMIGLVETATQLQNVANGTGSISITGSSLMKLFIDDEAIFLPLAVIADSNTGNLVIGPRDKNALINRLFSDGEYHFLFAKSFRTIEDTMKFYINQLSNIGIVPLTDAGESRPMDDFFSSYVQDIDGQKVDRRSRIYKIQSKSVKEGTDEVYSDLARGIYQIIKLSFDPIIKRRRIVDSSVSNPQGSIMSLFYKVCQEPLVEILMDTYGDTYNIVCRVPPFDKIGILEYSEGQIRGNGKEDGQIEDAQYSATVSKFRHGNKFMLEIDESDVYDEQLSWNTDFYTWYKMEAKGAFLGMQNATSLARIPIIFFSEYVDLWGSRPFEVVSNYNVADSVGSAVDKMQAIDDLIYLIESTFYLPFTRKGTILLNKGDRRFKKGSWIRYKKTGEIFYVDAVTNNFNISENSIGRSTVLEVSRGLVEKYVRGIVRKTSEGDVMLSYFDIVNLTELKSCLSDFIINNKSNISRNVTVNKTVLDFFCQRKQFEK